MAEEASNHDSGRDNAAVLPPTVTGRRGRGTSYASPASDVTRTPRQRPGDVARIDALVLSELAVNDSSPVKRLSAADEEDELEALAYADNPGAEDSEDEEDLVGDINSRLLEAQTERQDHAHEDAEVATEFARYLGQYQDSLKAEAEDRASEQELNANVLNILNQQEIFNHDRIPGAPLSWNAPTAPKDWQPAAPRTDRGQPATFGEVDNPGNWGEFTFKPKFENVNGVANTYVGHTLPTGARPVPANDDGNRVVGDWNFHYQGWSRGEAGIPFRSGATKDNPFPQYRKGSLCPETLTRLGMSKMRMMQKDGAPDALFFHQLILPIHDTTSKTIRNDPRTPFYPSVSKFSNMYAVGELNLGTGYGHSFTPTNPSELLQWDGTIVMDGVRGGSNGALLRRMDTRTGNTAYDEYIAEAFSKTRWLELKRYYKLCNNLTAPKRGQPGYDPAYKYDFIYKTIVHNINALTLFAGLDLCGDESTFGFNGWGEYDSGLLSLILNKPGVTRGGQIVLVSDVDRIRPRAYVHRHKLNERFFPSGGWGPQEVKLILDQLEPLCHENNSYRPRALFRERPHITWDNYFSGDNIMSYAGTHGFGLTMTCRRDRLPRDIPGMYLQKQKTASKARSKAARFNKPIFCIKSTAGGGAIQLTSFQSTSSCNIIHVNALNSLDLYAQARERGRGNNKRQWAIEMNESRKLYLNTYGTIDRLDHLIQNTNMSYR